MWWYHSSTINLRMIRMYLTLMQFSSRLVELRRRYCVMFHLCARFDVFARQQIASDIDTCSHHGANIAQLPQYKDLHTSSSFFCAICHNTDKLEIMKFSAATVSCRYRNREPRASFTRRKHIQKRSCSFKESNVCTNLFTFSVFFNISRNLAWICFLQDVFANCVC